MRCCQFFKVFGSASRVRLSLRSGNSGSQPPSPTHATAWRETGATSPATYQTNFQLTDICPLVCIVVRTMYSVR